MAASLKHRTVGDRCAGEHRVDQKRDGARVNLCGAGRNVAAYARRSAGDRHAPERSRAAHEDRERRPGRRRHGEVAACGRVEKHAHGVGTVIGDGEVRLAVAVEVANRDRQGIPSGERGLVGIRRRRSARNCRVEEHAHRIGTGIGDGEVRLAVAVDVANRDGEGNAPSGELGLVGIRRRRGARNRRVGKHAHGVGKVIGDGEVRLAVAVEVANRDGAGIEPSGELGLVGIRRRRGAWSRRVEKHAHGVGTGIGDGEVRLAVAVEVANRDRAGISPSGERGLVGKRRRRGARGRRVEKHAHGIGIEIGDGEVRLAVAIEIANRDGGGISPSGERGLVGIRRRRGARGRRVEQHAHGIGTEIGDGEVRLAVAVEIANRDGVGNAPSGELGLVGI